MLVGNIIELLLLSMPSFLYRARLKRRGLSAADASAAVGLRAGAASDYALAAIVIAVTGGLGLASLALIPRAQLATRGVTVGTAHSLTGYLGIALLALAEEMLFRGLIAGVLIRRLGFWRGNTLQALIFFAPHALLLLVSDSFWPILPVQLVAGWLLGWLRNRSQSIGAAWFAHAGGNLIAALAV
jgi:membrane protease YdiL (CAAX protease family)